MPVTITEDANSRRIRDGLNPSREKSFLISGTNDEDEALTELKASLSPYGLLWPNECSVDWEDQKYSGGFRLFRASVQYGPVPGGLGVGDGEELPTFTSEFSTQTIKLFNAPVVNNYPAPGEPSVDFLGNINVTSDGVEGVDIEIPVQQFSLTISIPTATFTPGYQATVARLTATINNATWRGFASKEVRFDGLSAGGTFGERTTLTYRFSVSPNATGLSVGPITGITKAGWDYLWVYSQQAADDVAKMFRPKPLQVNVNQVYQLSNFLLLGLGS